MVAEADDALMEKFFDAGTLTQDELLSGLEARRRRRHGSSRCCARRRRPTSACSRCSTRIVSLRAVAGRAAVHGVDADGRRRSPSTRRQRRRPRRSSGRPSPIRSPAASRCSACSPARSRPTRRCTTSTRDVAGAARPPACCCRERRRRNVPEIKAGDIGAVAKLKETQTGDLLADKGATVHVAADQVPRAGDLVRDRAEEPRRRGEDQHRAAPPAGRGPDRSATRAIRRPRSCCSPARGSCTSRSRSRS